MAFLYLQHSTNSASPTSRRTKKTASAKPPDAVKASTDNDRSGRSRRAQTARYFSWQLHPDGGPRPLDSSQKLQVPHRNCHCLLERSISPRGQTDRHIAIPIHLPRLLWRISPLQLNPLAPPKTISCTQHIKKKCASQELHDTTTNNRDKLCRE
jgi:hypothetical protein